MCPRLAKAKLAAMTKESAPQQVAGVTRRTWGGIWRLLWGLPLVVRVAIFAIWLGTTVTLTWASDQRPYDLWSKFPPTRAPGDFVCDRWTTGRGMTGKIERGEEVRILAEKRSENVDWIRIARKKGGACWMDRYYWNEASMRTPAH